MAATQILAAGNTAAVSSEFTLVDGERTLIDINGRTGGGVPIVHVEAKDPAGNFRSIGDLIGGAQTLTGPGTFRARRVAGETCGVFRG